MGGIHMLFPIYSVQTQIVEDFFFSYTRDPKLTIITFYFSIGHYYLILMIMIIKTAFIAKQLSNY